MTKVRKGARERFEELLAQCDQDGSARAYAVIVLADHADAINGRVSSTGEMEAHCVVETLFRIAMRIICECSDAEARSETLAHFMARANGMLQEYLKGARGPKWN